MKRLAVALAAGAAVSTLAYASASVLSVDGGTIQAGGSGVSCDTDGVKANWGLETDDNTVRSVRIDGIDTKCTGADMFVAVNGTRVGKATISGTSVSLPLATPFPSPESIQNVKVWIEG